MKRVAVILCAVLSAVAAQELARDFKACGQQLESTNGCMRDAVQDAISKLVKGVPEWDVPILEPYTTDFHEVEYSNAFMSGKMVVKNSNTYGISKAQILSVKSTPSEGRHRLEIDVMFPKIFIEGDYKAEGRLNDFNVGGKGLFNVSMEGVRTIWDITGRVENDRLVVEHVRMLPEVEKMKIYFDDLFNGNEAINIAARSFVNEYWPLFYRELLPITANEWDKEMTDFVNLVFSRLPYSQFFA